MIQFFFDLSFDAVLQIFLPTIYLNDKHSKPGYVDKKATVAVLESNEFDTEHAPLFLKKLLQIYDELQPKEIYKRFEKNAKSKKTLRDLLNDVKFGYLAKNYIDAKLDAFLNLVSENNLPLSINISRDKDFYNSQIQTLKKDLYVNLKFEKNENGVMYTMTLQDKQVMFYPESKQIIILLDKPSWLVFDKQLWQLTDINSNKLKPFLKKTTIDIPEKNVSEFFEKFIKDIVKKVEVQAIGFALITKNNLKQCRLSVDYHFFTDNFQFDLKFDYDGFTFKNSQTKQQHSIIENNKNQEIVVINYKRNIKQEQGILNLLSEEFQLEKTDSGFINYATNIKNNPYKNIEFLIKNKEKFENLGIQIDDIVIGGKTVCTFEHKLNFTHEVFDDWFDLKFVINVGIQFFTFGDIIENIKNKNPYYKLSDGTYFMIPYEWFAKYASLARFVRPHAGELHLPKSHYSILKDLLENKNILPPSPQNIAYEPSEMLLATLRPYQKEGVMWLLQHHNNNLGACLADDMGLGKTLQTLALLVAVQSKLALISEEFSTDLFTQNAARKDFLKTLVVLPSSLIFNWYNETKKFTPHFRILQYIGKDRKLWQKKIDRYDIVFTSYSTASKDIEILKKYHFNYVILDESQQIKNKDSLVFKSLSQITTKHKISLSGTPIENSLTDLWTQMQFINPGILGSYHFFVENYKHTIEKHHNQNALNELKTIVQPFILRRTKTEVLYDLPELSEQVIYCELSDREQILYETEKSKARNELLKISQTHNKLHVLNVLMRLRQLSNHPQILDENSNIESGKFNAITAYIETIVKTEQKILIFSSFTKHLAIYEKWCKSCNISFCKITGQAKLAEREKEVYKFENTENTKIFFISLKTGGVGLNLTRASYVLLLDPWWNPFAEQQAISRAHRIGQKNKVHAIKFISKNTIEEKIIELQKNKKLLSDNILANDDLPLDAVQNLQYLLS